MCRIMKDFHDIVLRGTLLLFVNRFSKGRQFNVRWDKTYISLNSQEESVPPESILLPNLFTIEINSIVKAKPYQRCLPSSSGWKLPVFVEFETKHKILLESIMFILRIWELGEFFRAYSSLKQHILFYSNGPSLWHGFSDIEHIKVN